MAENERTAAKATGHLLERIDKPWTVPFMDIEGHWWLLTDDGGKEAIVLPFAAQQVISVAYKAEGWCAA